MKKYVYDIHRFFMSNGKVKTLDNFLTTLPEYISKTDKGETMDYTLALQISKICNFMVEKGLLLKTYSYPTMCILERFISVPLTNFTPSKDVKKDLEYGSYDFECNGFLSIYDYFKNSVVPIVGVNAKGDQDIGTAYYIGDNRFVTAAHCITGLEKFNLLIKDKPIILEEVWFADGVDPDIYDLAIIKVSDEVNLPPFMLDESFVLDSVLVMGYPPIPGFDAVLVSEKAAISTELQQLMTKTSTGQVVAVQTSYMSKMEYFIINARVKGGNSGGPVINKSGKIVGTIFQLPMDSQGGSDGGRYDLMGFGVCLPSKYTKLLIKNHISSAVHYDGEYYIL